ncbi:hypothetical protein pah_c009o044 [Parachlamydia acanthamoebae str. Hall's coccus]|nr:hypothetical protein pah_c009o044 [Parachlamydia acanthamoebae str. Hall's coccus]
MLMEMTEMGSSVDRISFFTSLKDLKNYSWGFLAQDVSAGFSVALLSVPQAMAYAMVAGFLFLVAFWR